VKDLRKKRERGHRRFLDRPNKETTQPEDRFPRKKRAATIQKRCRGGKKKGFVD